MECKTAGVMGSLLESAGGGRTCSVLAGRTMDGNAVDAEEDITQQSRDTHAPYFKTMTNNHYQKLPLRKPLITHPFPHCPLMSWDGWLQSRQIFVIL